MISMEYEYFNESVPIPWDMVLNIFSFVPGRDLVINCRRVNKTWKMGVDNCHVWITKMDRDKVAYPNIEEMKEYNLDWKTISILRPFGRNLLKNWDGAEGLKYWQTKESSGDKFKLEPATNPPGSQPVPSNLNCKQVWATSYMPCIKEQTINLLDYVCCKKWLDKVQPEIEVSEWVANRFDCASKYQLTVKLCNAEGRVLQSNNATFVYHRDRNQWAENVWEKVSHTFKDYGPGVRYISFLHLGVDGQFWADHYGAKMAAPSVIVAPLTS